MRCTGRPPPDARRRDRCRHRHRQAIAERLARDGATLTLLARDARAARGPWRSRSARPRVACDIRDAAPSTRRSRRRPIAHGPINVLVANAGIGGPNERRRGRPVQTISSRRTSSARTAACAPRSATSRPASDPRHLVVISSILARIARARLHGLQRLEGRAARASSDRWRPSSRPTTCPVNAICPGWVDTTMAWTGIEGMATADGITRDGGVRPRDGRGAAPRGCRSRPTSPASWPGSCRPTRAA